MNETLYRKQRSVQQQMEGLKGGVRRPETKNMPQFLDQVSDSRENDASRPFAISLYAELAQVHKQAIIPYIPRMMASIVRSLPFSADSHQLHEACAKAVASVARYTIDPTRPYDSNQRILFNLCSPLLPVLASKLESSAAGAAICLQALVESEKWKFAHPDLQGLICSNVTAALLKQGSHTFAFLHLAKSLTKFSKDAAHLHMGEWVRIGLRVLQADSGIPGSWQQRVVAAQLIAVILKTEDVGKLGLDLRATMKILEAYQMDKVTVVQIAVAEALETIKGITLEKCVRHDLAESGCKSKSRNSDTEDSGLQELSGSISPKSDASSHEAVPSMASSTAKFGMMPSKCLNRQPSDSLRLSSHASLKLSRPSKQKENTLAAIPRQVLSEIPASGKLSSNPEVLPSSCPPKLLNRSSVDLGIQVQNYFTQDRGLFGSEKSIQNQIHECAVKTSSPVRKHAEGCQNFSNVGCTCALNKEEDGSNDQVAVTDDLSGKADSESLEEHDDCVKEGMHKLPIAYLCRRGCMNDNCSTHVLISGCTDNVLSGMDASNGALTESLIAVDTGSHLQVEKPHAVREDFTFRAPCSLLHSLESSSSNKRRRKNCKKCIGSDSYLPNEASWTGKDDLASGESGESHVVATDYESRDETSGASCCTLEDVNVHRDRFFKSGSCTHRRCVQKINDRAGECLSVKLNDCGQDQSSSRDTLDSEYGDDEKIESRQSSNLHRRSKKNGPRKHFTGQMGGHTTLSVGPDYKSRGVNHSDRRFVVSEVSQKHGAFLGLVCAVAIFLVAAMVMKHVNQIYDSHALVPT